MGKNSFAVGNSQNVKNGRDGRVIQSQITPHGRHAPLGPQSREEADDLPIVRLDREQAIVVLVFQPLDLQPQDPQVIQGGGIRPDTAPRPPLGGFYPFFRATFAMVASFQAASTAITTSVAFRTALFASSP